MTTEEAREELEVSEVYLVTTSDPMSLIGEYAGLDERHRLVFVAGPYGPVHVPAQKIVDWERIT